jgi:hypothetical protein
MNHSDFVIGEAFLCAATKWRCTDIGSRTIAAICIDYVEVGGNIPEVQRRLNHAEAEQAGWFNGPPYAVIERVFDEEDQKACTHIVPVQP